MTTLKVPAKLRGLTDINAYSDAGAARKELFHSLGKKFLKAIATALDLKKGEFEVRSNQAGIAVSGEVTLHTNHIYVQLSEHSFGRRGISILYRTCKGQKDYTGGQNNFADIDTLVDHPHEAERFLQRLVNMTEQMAAQAA